MFTRGSKRTKTAPAAPEPVAAPEPAPSTLTRRGKKPKERDEEPEQPEKKSRTRVMDLSTPKTPNDSIINPKRRKTTRSSAGKVHHDQNTAHASASEATEYDSVNLVGSTIVNDTANGVSDTSNQPTIISLPFSDTPVINRNKEMRKQNKGTRRSSLGLRGRRASSLIENGHSAIPHREVETSEFYKHIEADGLSEPRRMKQLLTWTGERELGEKPSHGEANDLSEQAGMFPRSHLEPLC
jgi:kinetochore protein Mis13/DSN1